MIHGKKVGRKLRVVPPERLPIWGQRWSANHNARAAAPFETRAFQVTAHGMFQVGPTLSSPSQFHATIGGAGQEDGNYSPNPTCVPIPSPSPVQTYATELTSSSSSTFHMTHHHSLLLHHRDDHMPSMSQGQPNALRRNPVHRVSRRQNMVGPPGGMLPLQAGSEFPPSTHHRMPPLQRGFVPLEHDDTFWHTNSPSTSTHPRAGSSRESHIASGQLQEFLLPDASHWQFAAGPSQSTIHSHQSGSFLRSERSYHPGLYPDNRTGVYLTPPSSPQCFIPQQNGTSSSWLPESGVPVVPTPLSFQNPTMTQWPSGSGSGISRPLQSVGSSSDIDEDLRRWFSNQDPGHPSPLEESLSTFAQPPADGSILLLDTIDEGGHSTQMIG